MAIDLSAITNILSQLLPTILQIVIIGMVISLIFGTLMPTITGIFK